MTKYLTLSILFILSIINFKSESKASYPLLPDKFTQTFSFYDSQTKANITGKIWFDSQVGQKYEYINSGQRCFNYPSSYDCTHIITKGKGYIIIPSKSVCCLKPQLFPLSTDIFSQYQYKGQDNLNGTNYDLWTYYSTSLQIGMDYWSNKSSKPAPIPRRFVYNSNSGAYQQRDYWVNTYSQTFDSNTVFFVPSYCKQLCKMTGETGQNQQTNLGQFMFKDFQQIQKEKQNLKAE